MNSRNSQSKKQGLRDQISLSAIMSTLVCVIVLLALLTALAVFVRIYQNSMEQNAITSSEQAVVQVKNTIASYTDDMNEVMTMIRENSAWEEPYLSNFLMNLMEIRSDVVAVTAYDDKGEMIKCWTRRYRLKENIFKNLSYIPVEEGKKNGIHISSPHVESMFVNEYPWVVTISQYREDREGGGRQIAMDIRFSNIANYVDEVGIGQHGYCFIMDSAGDIVYHPQQQLLNSGLKEENTEELKGYADGTHAGGNVIYTIHTLDTCDWRIVGVCYIDEMITGRVKSMVRIVILILALVLFTAFVSGVLFSRFISRPANRLAQAMEEFEKNPEDFNFGSIGGTSEIIALSDSFDHMVVQIQELMEKVRQEEIFLRKTELNALQAQINPHFLYNTLDSIAWMCEEERTKEAVEMVNALAKLFRISISKGHELIPLKYELRHAESYLKIQKFRYGNQFSYFLDVDEACLTYLCNKITLQPIIENAIYHGLDMVDEGEIHISIHFCGEDILLAVEDNGVGMTEEHCREILHREAGDRTGIGIKNVHERIRIYFGEKYGLHITSELDVGTRVEILIPKVLEGSYDAK